MFAWIVLKILLASVLFGDEFVDQLNLCDLVIQPSSGLLAFSQNKNILAPPLFQNISIFQNRSQDLSIQTKALPKPEYL
jgi:hypothetical protein